MSNNNLILGHFFTPSYINDDTPKIFKTKNMYIVKKMRDTQYHT